MIAAHYTNSKNNIRLEFCFDPKDAVKHFFIYFDYQTGTDGEQRKILVSKIKKIEKINVNPDYFFFDMLQMIEQGNEFFIYRCYIRSKDKNTELKNSFEKIFKIMEDEKITWFFSLYTSSAQNEFFGDLRSKILLPKENSQIWTFDGDQRYPYLYVMLIR